MVRLTRAQEEVFSALHRLSGGDPVVWHDAVQVRDERLDGREDAHDTYLRTTQNALVQIEAIVPRLVQHSAVGWRLTAVGRVMAETQLKLE